MRRIAALAATLALVCLPVGAAEKRAFEIADLYRVAQASAPAVSHDGSRVAFSLKRYEFEKGESWSELWLMNADGSDLRQLTFGRHDDSSPKFSPDGKTLVFVSDRSGGSQLHLLPLGGGESRQLTHFAPGFSDPVWSPDGRYLAAAATVFPECGLDSACNEKLAKDVAEGKLLVHVADELLYRHWTEWHDGRSSHVFLIDATSGAVVRDLTPGRWDSPTFSAGGGRGYDFSPDGKELCYHSNHDRDQALSTNADVWIVPVEPAGGTVTETTAVNLTAGNKGWDGSCLYSPDGRYLAFRSQEKPGAEADLFRLALWDRQAKAVRYLTDRSSFDDMIDEMAWTADGTALVFQAEVEARTPLLRIATAGGKAEKVLTDAFLEGWVLAADGRAAVYTRRSIDSPHEVYRADLATTAGSPRRLTRFNAELEKEVDIRPAEELWIDAGPYKIHTFVIKPHGFDPARKYPLILNVHGGPQSQWNDSFRGDWQVYPGKGYVVAFANPTGSTGYGQDFTDAIACDYGGRVFQDLMKVTDALEKLPYVDRDRMGAMGWSFGGYMMMWFEGHTTRFKTLAAMMGLYDLPSFYGATEELWFPEKDLCGTPWTSEHYRRWSPAEAAAQFKTPALVITGEKDYRVPYTQSLGFFTALQRQGIPSRLVVYPDAGHWPGWIEMAFYYNVHLDWFHRFLGGEAAPYDVEAFARNRTFQTNDESKEPVP
jgi:dipeptidyl aminopeptidase/acylaminoacyl peptidase